MSFGRRLFASSAVLSVVLCGFTPLALSAAHADTTPTLLPGQEVTSLRDAYSTTVVGQTPGTYDTTVHARPIHYRDSTGAWQDIDTTLVPTADGGFRSAANAISVSVNPTAVSGEITQLTLTDGSSVGFGVQGALPVAAPVVTGSEIKIPNLLSATTFDLFSRYNGLKDNIVLANASAPTSFVFPLYLHGLTASLDADGNVLYKDASGVEQARTPHGYMTDSAIDPRSGDPAYSNGVTYSLVAAGPTGTELKITLDTAWLTNPARKFPVTVDPTATSTTYGAGSDDTYVQYPYTNDYSTDTILKSGTFDGGADKARSFIHFAGINALDGKVINSATVKVYENWSFSCTSTPVDLYRVTESWTGSGLHSYPGWTLGAKIDEVSAHYGYSSCPTGAYVNFDATSAMVDWANNTWANDGVALRAPDETDDYEWKKWDSVQGTNDPKIVVNWQDPDRAPNRAGKATVSGNTCGTCAQPITADNTPTFTTSATDPDSGDTVEYFFEVYSGTLTSVDSSGGATVSGVSPTASGNSTPYVTSGTADNWTPSAALADHAYSVRVRAYDGQLYGPWSGWTNFTIDSSGPGTSVSSPDHPSQSSWYSGTSASVNWSASSESGIQGYSWAFDQNSATVPDTISDGTSTSATYTGLGDGTYYFHVRAENNANVWGATSTFAIHVDSTAPAAPTGLSADHVANVPSNNQAIGVSWNPGSDAMSGVAGYSYAFNNSATTPADGSIETTGTSVNSGQLANGTWWFHVRTIDAAGNASADAVTGPFLLEGSAPAAPTVTASAPQTAWTSNRTVTFNWTQPNTLFGVAGYSVTLDQTATEALPNVVSTVSQSTMRTIPDGVWYLHVAAISNSGVLGVVANYKVMIDGTVPTLPSLSSGTHPNTGAWYSANSGSIGVSASAVSGIVGWAYSVDQNAAGDPGQSVTASGASLGFSNLADGVWYAHVRAISGSGLISGITTYPLHIDITAPTAPALTSPDHNTTEATNQYVINLDWTAALGTDATSGVSGYSVAVNSSATTPADGSVDQVGAKFSYTAPGDGTYYLHVRTVDLAGNLSPDIVFGPVTISASAPPVGAASTSQFIQLWQPRVTSDTWGPAYLAQSGYPASILAEGFHGMNLAQQNYLIQQLFQALLQDNPAPTELTSTQLQMVQASLFNFVFDKDKAAAALGGAVNDGLTSLVNTVNSVTAALPPILQDLLATAQSLYDGIDLTLPDLPTETFDELLPDFEEIDPSTLVDVGSALSSDATDALNAIDTGTTDPVNDVEQTINQVVTAAGNAVDPTPIFNAVPLLPVSADYQACWESAKNSGCRAGVIGVPTPVDVTGDGTSDLLLSFGPSASVNPASPSALNLTYTLQRFPLASDTSNNPISAHVWVNYDIGAVGKRLLIGFDGYRRGAALSESTTATIGLPDPTNIANGDMVFGYSLSHTSPASSWALTLGLRNLTGDADPRDASLLFTPPVQISGQLTLSNDVSGSTTDRTVSIDNTSSDATRLDGLFDTSTKSTNETTNTRFVIDKLPTSAHLSVNRNYDGTTTKTTVNTTGSDVVNQVTVNRRVTTGSVIETSTLDLRKLPTSTTTTITAANGHSQGSYVSHNGETLSNVGFADAIHTSGTLTNATTLAAASVPSSVNVGFGKSQQSGDDSTTLDYTASAGMPSASFSTYDRPNAVSVVAAATNIPEVVTASASKANHSFSAYASTPIGKLTFAVSRNGGKVLHLPQEHLTYVGHGTALGAEAVISGLLHADASFSDVISGSTDFAPGGQRLRVVAQNDTIAGHLDISNLPSHVEWNLDRPNLTAHLATSSVINTLSFSAMRRPGGPIIDGSVASLPSTIDITGTLGSSAASVSYRSDLPLGDAQVMYSSDANPNDNSGITVRGHVQNVPTQVDASFDRSAKTVHFAANQPVGLINVSVTRNGGKATQYSGDHVSFSGTPTTFAGNAVIHGLTAFDADYHGGVSDTTASLTVLPGGQPFVLGGSLDNDRMFAKLSNLPAHMSLNLHGLRDITYDATSPISRFMAYKSTVGTGPTFQASVNNVPTHIDVSADLTSPHYKLTYAGSSGADYVKGYYSNKYVGTGLDAKDNFATGFVDHPPANVTIDANTSAGSLDYQADSPTRAAGIQVKDLFGSGLQLYANASSVPAHFTATRTSTSASFTGVDQPLGSIDFRASNHGAPANRSGDHLYVRYSKQSGQFNVSARATDVSSLSYSKSGDKLAVDSNVNLHGNPFAVDVQVDGPAPSSDSSADQYRVSAKGVISALPAHIDFDRNGNHITYNATTRLDVSNLSVNVGWIAALGDAANPPARNGVSVTDGACGPGNGCTPTNNAGQTEGFCNAGKNICEAFKVRYNMDGLGTVDVQGDPSGQFANLDNMAPGGNEIQVRLQLRYVSPLPITVDLSQKGVTAGTDLNFGPLHVHRASDANGGGIGFTVETHHSHALGSLSANVSLPGSSYTLNGYRYRNLRGTVVISSEPADLVLDAGFGGNSQGTLQMSSGISRIDLHAYADADRDTQQGWASVGVADGRVLMTGIPAAPIGGSAADSWSVVRPTGSSGSRTADDVPNLDIKATQPGMGIALNVDDILVPFDSTSANGVFEPLRLSVGGMGTELAGTVDLTNHLLHLTTSGGSVDELSLLGGVDVNASIPIHTSKTLKVVKFTVDGEADVQASIPRVSIDITNINDLTLQAGTGYVAYEVQGSYGQFQLSAGGLDVNANVTAHVQGYAWPYWSWEKGYDKNITLVKGEFHQLWSHVAQVLPAGQYGDAHLCIDVPAPWGSASVALLTNPAPTFDDNPNIVTLQGSDGDQVFTILDPYPGHTQGDGTQVSKLVPGLIDLLVGVKLSPSLNHGWSHDTDTFASCADRGYTN